MPIERDKRKREMGITVAKEAGSKSGYAVRRGKIGCLVERVKRELENGLRVDGAEEVVERRKLLAKEENVEMAGLRLGCHRDYLHLKILEALIIKAGCETKSTALTRIPLPTQPSTDTTYSHQRSTYYTLANLKYFRLVADKNETQWSNLTGCLSWSKATYFFYLRIQYFSISVRSGEYHYYIKRRENTRRVVF